MRQRGPADDVVDSCAELLMRNDAVRERIASGVFQGCEKDGIERLERAFALAHEVAPSRRNAADRGFGEDWDSAVAAGLLTPGEAAQIRAASDAAHAAIRVDDFAADELSRRQHERGPRQRSAHA